MFGFPAFVLGSFRGNDEVEELLPSVKSGLSEVVREADDVLARSRFRARSLAMSIFSRAVSAGELPVPLTAALSLSIELG